MSNALAPGMKKRAKANRRQALKAEAQDLNEILLKRFDVNGGGSLCKDEVKTLMETICNEVTPGLGMKMLFHDTLLSDYATARWLAITEHQTHAPYPRRPSTRSKLLLP